MSESGELQNSDPVFNKWNRRAKLFNAIGWPTIIIITAAFSIRSVCFWAAPMAESIAKKHVDTLEMLDKTQRDIVTAQNSIARSIDTQAENGREFVAISKRQEDKLDAIHKAVVKPKTAGD